MAPRRVVLRNSSPESAPASDDSGPASAGESGAEDAGLAFSSSSESDIDYASGGRAPAVRLTARQRALAARSGDDSADDTVAAAAPMDDEDGERMAAAPAPRSAPDAAALQREEQKRRRTDQRDARLQQTRAETIQRLLQKKGGRAARRAAAAPAADAEDAPEARPHWTDERVPADAVRVVVRPDGAVFGVGEKYAGALPQQMSAPPPVVPQRCAARGCTSARTCVHPQSGRPMCASLRCYRALS